MASKSGYNKAAGFGQGISSELRARDLPSKRLLGKGLASIGYETELNGERFARIDFIGVPSGTFQKEADVLVELKDHKNVVKTHGRTVDKMSCSLVLEYLEDDLLGLLQKRKESQRSPADGNQYELRRSQPFELPEALDIILQITRGMEYLHEQEILHGDLKTKNILVTHLNDGDKNLLSVKVADFGLIRTKRKSMSFVSRQARKLDVVQWKAPEHLEILLLEDKDETSSESDSNSDEECKGSPGVTDGLLLGADIYSFAVTCIQILTGEDPYPNLNWKVLGAKIVSGELRPKVPAACPPVLKDLLVSCWGKAPAQRPTFSNIRKTLEHLHTPQTELLQDQMLHELLQDQMLHIHKVGMTGELTEEELIAFSLQQDEAGRTSGVTEQHQSLPTLEQRMAGVQVRQEFDFRDAQMSNLQSGESTYVRVGETSPKRYLALATECMEKVQGMTSPQFNHGLCQYLAIKLLLAVQSAQKQTRSSALESIELSHGAFKLLFILAKEVESFTHACCNDGWIQYAITLTNVSEHVSLLGYELDLCRMFLLNAKGAGLLVTVNESEAEIVGLRATQDQYRLLEKVKTVIQSSNDPSTLECQLASKLLGRLTPADPSMLIPGSEGSSLSSSWEIDYASLEQLEKLGTGSTSVVHKTRWLGALVAQKTIYGVDHPSFRTEVSILTGLSHPNIVPIFGYAMGKHCCSIVMELMEGDLFHLIESRMQQERRFKYPFPIPEVVDIILQVAKGVNYLHKNGIVHGDLKSYNILIKSTKHVNLEYVYAKVADFGLSYIKEASRWMAPELMHSKGTHRQSSITITTSDEVKKYCPFKSDVYSFAMVCYEILSGEVPFQSIRSPNVKGMVMDGQRPKIPISCPDFLKTLIQKCWHSDASSRPNFDVICLELSHLKYSMMTDTLKGTMDHMDPQFSSQPNELMGTILDNLRDKIVCGDEEDLDPVIRHRQLYTMKTSLSLPAAQLGRAISFPAGVSRPKDEDFLLSISTVLPPTGTDGSQVAMPEKANLPVFDKCNYFPASDGRGYGPLPTSHTDCLYKFARPGISAPFFNEGSQKPYDYDDLASLEVLEKLRIDPDYQPPQRSSDAPQEGINAVPAVTGSPSRKRKQIEPRLRAGFKKLMLEVRPLKFKKKLWFGTYTEEKVDRARDAVNYYVGCNEPYILPDSPLIFAERPLKGIKFKDLLPSCDQVIQVGDKEELAYMYFARQVKEVINSVTGKFTVCKLRQIHSLQHCIARHCVPPGGLQMRKRLLNYSDQVFNGTMIC